MFLVSTIATNLLSSGKRISASVIVQALNVFRVTRISYLAG